LWITGIEPSAGPRSKRNVAVSLSPPSAYLAFLFRSPPAPPSLDCSKRSEMSRGGSCEELREKVGRGGARGTNGTVPCGKRRDSRGGREAHRVRNGALGPRHERQLSTRRVSARADRVEGPGRAHGRAR